MVKRPLRLWVHSFKCQKLKVLMQLAYINFIQLIYLPLATFLKMLYRILQPRYRPPWDMIGPLIVRPEGKLVNCNSLKEELIWTGKGLVQYWPRSKQKIYDFGKFNNRRFAQVSFEVLFRSLEVIQTVSVWYRLWNRQIDFGFRILKMIKSFLKYVRYKMRCLTHVVLLNWIWCFLSEQM